MLLSVKIPTDRHNNRSWDRRDVGVWVDDSYRIRKLMQPSVSNECVVYPYEYEIVFVLVMARVTLLQTSIDS